MKVVPEGTSLLAGTPITLHPKDDAPVEQRQGEVPNDEEILFKGESPYAPRHSLPQAP